MYDKPDAVETNSEENAPDSTAVVTDVDIVIVSENVIHPSQHNQDGEILESDSITMVPSDNGTLNVPVDVIDVSDIQELDDCSMAESSEGWKTGDGGNSYNNTKEGEMEVEMSNTDIVLLDEIYPLQHKLDKDGEILVSGPMTVLPSDNGTLNTPVDVIDISDIKNMGDCTMVDSNEVNTTGDGGNRFRYVKEVDIEVDISNIDATKEIDKVEFDLNKFCTLLEDSERIDKVIEGKDVLLFLGPTGVGKTSTLLYLCGVEFHDSNEGYTPINVQKELSHFVISHKSTSCTSSVMATEIMLDGQSLVLCDTPGFGDTGGVEADFANNLNLIRAIHLAKSIKPIVVLNAACTTDRFRSLREILDTLSRMMSIADDVDFTAMSFVFTNCSARESKKLCTKLLDLRSELHKNIHQSTTLLKILDVMIKASTPSAIFIDLLERDNAPLKQELSQQEKMNDPHLAFNFFAAEKPWHCLQIALNSTVQDIQCFVQDENFYAAHEKIQMMVKVARLVSVGPAHMRDNFDMNNLMNQFLLICELRMNLLIGLSQSDKAAFHSKLQKLGKVYATIGSLNDLMSACGLPETHMLVVSKSTVDSLLKDILEYKHASLDADTIVWKLYQLHHIALMTKCIFGSNGDWEIYLRAFDCMSYKIDQEIEIIGYVIVNKPLAVIEQFDNLPYFKRIIKLMKEYSIRDGEQAIPFESRTVSTMKKLKENIALFMSDLLQVGSKQHSVSQETINTFTFDIQLGASRSYLWNMKQVPDIFGSENNLGINIIDVDESIRTYDESFFHYLDQTMGLVEQRVQKLKLFFEGQVSDDPNKIQNEIKLLFEVIGKLQFFADSTVDWQSFDKKRLSALQMRNASHLTQVRLYSDELDRASVILANEYKVASCSARAFLKRCKKEKSSLASLLSELSLPENFISWSKLIEESGTLQSRLFTFYRAFTKSETKLSDVISEIISLFQEHIFFSMTNICRMRPRLPTELHEYYLDTHAKSLQLVFAFMKLNSSSKLFKQILNCKISNELSNFWNALVSDFNEIQTLPIKLCISFNFDGLANILNIWKSGECSWREIRAFAGMPPSMLAIQGHEYLFSDFQKHIQSCWTYKKLASECFVALAKVQEEINEMSFVSMLDSPWNDRLDYFNHVSILLSQTIGLQRLHDHVQNDVHKSLLFLEVEAMSKITSGMLKLRDSIDMYLLQFPNDELCCNRIASTLHSFECIDKVFSGKKQKLSQIACEHLCDVKISSENIMKSLYSEPLSDIPKCLDDLITLKKTSNNLPPWSISINLCIEAYLDFLVLPSDTGKDFIMDLSFALKAVKGKDSSIAQQLLSDHSVFEGMMNFLFDEATQGQDIDYVLREVQGIDSHSKSLLHKMYNSFESVYMSDIEEGMISRMAGTDLLRQLAVKTKENLDDYSTDYATQITIIIAHIFAYWSLRTENAMAVTQLRFMKKPHAAQVVVTLLMLNAIECEYLTLKNILVELKTGEGKSIVLGVAATCLAMFGVDVDCISYSSYLSQRDYKDFEGMFKAFDVIGKIRYGTIGDFGRKLLGDYYDNAECVINGLPPLLQTFPSNRKPNVLLVDEVDVFFGKDVFGKGYYPCTFQSNDAVRTYFRSVWEDCGSNQDFGTHILPESVLQSLSEESHGQLKYEANRIWKAAATVKCEENQEYVISGKCIKYVLFDGLHEYTSYEHMFRYIKEALRGNFTMSDIEHNLGFIWATGALSFAEFPFEYDAVIGVSGTLKGISSLEKEVLCNQYGIVEHVFVPSMYGSNKLNFAGDNGSDVLMCDSKADFFLDLKHDIIKRQKQGVISDALKRPILVFFSTKKMMMEFYDSSFMTSMKPCIQIITEESSHKERTSLFLKATERGAVTLMIRVFGRGTDFKCFDKQMLTEGGVHVIQAFFSTDVSEEIQLKGRTARQGAYGSFSMVVLAEEVTKDLSIDTEKIQAMKQQGIYSSLVAVRRKNYDGKVKERIQKVKDTEAMHYSTLACRDAMRNCVTNDTKNTILSFFKEYSTSYDSKAFTTNEIKKDRLLESKKKLKELFKAEKDRRSQAKHDRQLETRKEETNRVLYIEASEKDKERMRVRAILASDKAYTPNALLGIRDGASKDEILHSFYDLSKLFHPDKCNESDAHEIFLKIKQAKQDLTSSSD